jgi:hypothetical protein
MKIVRLRSTGLLLGLLLLGNTLPAMAQIACGTERWNVKTGMDSEAATVDLGTVHATSVSTLVSLPGHRISSRTKRIAGSAEYKVWQVQATLTAYKLERKDSDYHLVLQDPSGKTMIAELPSPNCLSSSSPFATGIRNARTEFDRKFVVKPNRFTHVNVPVKVTGIGFYDFSHGQTGIADNRIELHPVIDIHFNP